jgi:hypothetical protein
MQRAEQLVAGRKMIDVVNAEQKWIGRLPPGPER